MSAPLPVSLCLIARDEEDLLPSCLASVSPLVQEMIVVDTGSVDRTRDVAERAGARVFTFPWNGDFAAARNFSLAQARGEWILVLDADELLEPVEREEFGRLLADPGVEGYFVAIRSFVGRGEEVAEDWAVRLFRNRPEYRFAGIIHEQVAGAIQARHGGSGLARAGLVIDHFGYLDRRLQAKRKRERNLALLAKALADHPGDPFLHYSLAVEYLQQGAVKSGAAHLEKALDRLAGCEGYFREVLVLLALAQLKEGQPRKARRTLARALRALPGDADLLLLRGLLDYRTDRSGAALADLRQALAGGSRLLARHHLHSALGEAYALLGRFPEAEAEYVEALRLAPEALYPLTRLVGLKASGRATLPWREIGRFAGPSLLRLLPRRLHELGEGPLAVIVAFLAVLRAAEEDSAAGLREAALGCAESVAKACGPEAGPLRDCLLAGAATASACAAALEAGLACALFQPREETEKAAVACLDAAAALLCPAGWAPGPGEERPPATTGGSGE
ncbi:MAG TPA: glycosyltransferase [Firmicutes bacterium]|nr:glycosyltransferase [Bacillota bacterium]